MESRSIEIGMYFLFPSFARWLNTISSLSSWWSQFTSLRKWSHNFQVFFSVFTVQMYFNLSGGGFTQKTSFPTRTAQSIKYALSFCVNGLLVIRQVPFCSDSSARMINAISLFYAWETGLKGHSTDSPCPMHRASIFWR